MERYKLLIVILGVILGVLVCINLVIFFCRDHFLPLPNHQPFKSVWSVEDKREMRVFLTKSQEIMRNNQIDMVAMYDTLLGLVRHQGVIPWNDGLSFVVDKNRKDLLFSLRDKFAVAGIGLTAFSPHVTKMYPLNKPLIPGRNWSWPFIDIRYYTKKGNKITVPQGGINVCTSLWCHWFPSADEFSADDFFPLRTNLFEGVPLNIPNKVDDILNSFYGRDWEVSCQSSTYNHHQEKGKRSRGAAPCRTLNSSPTREGIFDNVWVINLDRRPERWRTTRERLSGLGITAHRWSATDKEAPSVVSEYKSLQPKIRRGEFACYKSHLNLWRSLYERNVNYAIIFEDDISVPPSVTLQAVTQTIEDSTGFDVLLLGHCAGDIFHRKPKGTSRVGSAMCLHAYAVSREGLRKLLNDTHLYDKPVDAYLHRIYCGRNLCYYAKDRRNPAPNTWAQGLFSQDASFVTDIQADKHSLNSLAQVFSNRLEYALKPVT